jgi:hypothetical protein
MPSSSKHQLGLLLRAVEANVNFPVLLAHTPWTLSHWTGLLSKLYSNCRWLMGELCNASSCLLIIRQRQIRECAFDQRFLSTVRLTTNASTLLVPGLNTTPAFPAVSASQKRSTTLWLVLPLSRNSLFHELLLVHWLTHKSSNRLENTVRDSVIRYPHTPAQLNLTIGRSAQSCTVSWWTDNRNFGHTTCWRGRSCWRRYGTVRSFFGDEVYPAKRCTHELNLHVRGRPSRHHHYLRL